MFPKYRKKTAVFGDFVVFERFFDLSLDTKRDMW